MGGTSSLARAIAARLLSQFWRFGGSLHQARSRSRTKMISWPARRSRRPGLMRTAPHGLAGPPRRCVAGPRGASTARTKHLQHPRSTCIGPPTSSVRARPTRSPPAPASPRRCRQTPGFSRPAARPTQGPRTRSSQSECCGRRGLARSITAVSIIPPARPAARRLAEAGATRLPKAPPFFFSSLSLFLPSYS